MGTVWREVEREVIHVLVVQVGDLRGKCCHFNSCPPPLGQAAFPQISPSHTQLLSFLLTELFFLILILGGFNAKI